MIKAGFLSSADRALMLACVKRYDEDYGIVRHVNALLLFDDGKSCAIVSQILTLWLEGRFCLNTVPIVAHIHAVYCADAVHREHQAKPAYGWVRRGSKPAIKTHTGRGGRVNIHGALNLETFSAPFIEASTVDGQSAVQLLTKIEERNPDKPCLHIIWDNAAYHKGCDVRAFLSRPDCRLHLIQFPPCPHLNPIERLWAVLHEHITHNRVYEAKHPFVQAILTFLCDTIPDNFQIISNQNYQIWEG